MWLDVNVLILHKIKLKMNHNKLVHIDLPLPTFIKTVK